MLLKDKDIEKIIEKCKSLNVKNLYLFGSAMTDNFSTNSDIDLLVDFEDLIPENYFDNYYNLKEFLENYFNRDIDLLEFKALKNKYLIEEINKNKLLIYGKTN